MVRQGIAGETLGAERSIPALFFEGRPSASGGQQIIPKYLAQAPGWTAAKNSDGGSTGGLRPKYAGGDDAYGRVRSKPAPFAQSNLMKSFR